MKSRPILLAIAALCLILCRSAGAQTAGNAWHIPDNSNDLSGTFMRDPRFEIGTNSTVTIYNGNQFQGAGNPGNQTGGMLFFKGASQSVWMIEPLVWDRESGNNKFWRGSFSTDLYAANEPVFYFLQITYSDHPTTYVYGQDIGGVTATNMTTAISIVIATTAATATPMASSIRRSCARGRV